MISMDFHVHSKYSLDGEMTVWRIAEQAVDLRLNVIGIVDHVRGHAPWLESRQLEIDIARECFENQLKIFSGIEVSLLNPMPKESKWYDYVVVSPHSIPKSVKIASRDKSALILKWWSKAMNNLLKSDSGHVVGHPDRILNGKFKLDNGSARDFLRQLESSQWFVELNPKSKYPDQFLLRTSHRPKLGQHLIFGSDAHTRNQFRGLHASLGVVESALTSVGNERFLRHLGNRT